MNNMNFWRKLYMVHGDNHILLPDIYTSPYKSEYYKLTTTSRNIFPKIRNMIGDGYIEMQTNYMQFKFTQKFIDEVMS